MTRKLYAAHDAEGRILRRVSSSPENVDLLPHTEEVGLVEAPEGLTWSNTTHKVVDGQIVPI